MLWGRLAQARLHGTALAARAHARTQRHAAPDAALREGGGQPPLLQARTSTRMRMITIHSSRAACALLEWSRSRSSISWSTCGAHDARGQRGSTDAQRAVCWDLRTWQGAAGPQARAQQLLRRRAVQPWRPARQFRALTANRAFRTSTRCDSSMYSQIRSYSACRTSGARQKNSGLSRTEDSRLTAALRRGWGGKGRVAFCWTQVVACHAQADTACLCACCVVKAVAAVQCRRRCARAAWRGRCPATHRWINTCGQGLGR